MNQPDPARVLSAVVHEIGLNLPGLLEELEKIPRSIYDLRQKISPLKAELALLESRYESKGRSPSHYDIARSMLLSSLKEDARANYRRNPEFREDSKGKTVKIELTDGRAEDAAHAAPSYKSLVEQADNDRRRMAEIGKEIGSLYDLIEGIKGRKEFILQSLEVGKMLGYNRSGEMKLG